MDGFLVLAERWFRWERSSMVERPSVVSLAADFRRGEIVGQSRRSRKGAMVTTPLPANRLCANSRVAEWLGGPTRGRPKTHALATSGFEARPAPPTRLQH